MTSGSAKFVIVNDSMQNGYVYECTEPVGKHFGHGFQPQLTPKKLLSMGIFGGKYMTDCWREFPTDWFENARLSQGGYDVNLNFFKVRASQTLSYWREKGWIHKDDPRGWFQWYCRYYVGRRHEDDQRQIRRWKGMSLHIAQIRKNCIKGDLTCRPRQRQALLHWAYDSRDF